MWIPAVLLVLVALPLLFPTGRPPTPRWRIVGWGAVAGGVLLFVGNAFLAGPLENYDWVDNPLGVAWMPGFVSWVGFALWWATTIAAVVSIVVRFRRSHGTEREQLKWFTAAAALLVVAFVVSFSLSSVIGENAGWGLIAAGLLGVALAVGGGDPAPPALRHRRRDQPRARLRRADRHARRHLPRARAADRARGRALGLRGRRLDARGGGAVRPGAGAHPGRGRPPLLPPPVRRGSGRSRRSRRGCATRSTSTRSTPSCAGSCTATIQPAHVSLWLRAGADR